jgi:hypothetical protein
MLNGCTDPPLDCFLTLSCEVPTCLRLALMTRFGILLSSKFSLVPAEISLTSAYKILSLVAVAIGNAVAFVLALLVRLHSLARLVLLTP